MNKLLHQKKVFLIYLSIISQNIIQKMRGLGTHQKEVRSEELRSKKEARSEEVRSK